MTISTVTIAGVSPDPEVYGGLTAAISYVGGMFGDAADAWLALTTSRQGKTLVTATRYIDAQAWDGTATGLAGGTPTTLQWPRSGILLADGTTLDATDVPPEVVQATFELAVLISADPDVVAAADTSTNIRSVSGGGGVGVEFFNPTSTRDGSATRLPTVLQRLIGKYLGTATGSAADGSYGQGAGSRSQFGHCRGDGRSWPY